MGDLVDLCGTLFPLDVVTLAADLNLGTDLDKCDSSIRTSLMNGKGARLRVNPKVELAMVR
jgi:hypothetical protein